MRAIDRHEDAILFVLELCDDGGATFATACDSVAREHGLTAERLAHLTRTWCAVGGFPCPS